MDENNDRGSRKKITLTLQTFPQGRRLANWCGGKSRTRTKREQTELTPLSSPEKKILVIFGPPSYIHTHIVFNLKVDRQRSREYFTSDAIYNGSAGMTLYYVCRSWQDCCRRGENRSWPSISVESVDSECWCLNNAIFLRFHNAVNSGRTSIYLESYLKTMSYAHCRQSCFEKFRRQAPVKSAIAKMIKKLKTAKKVARNMVKRVGKCTEMNGHHFQYLL